ncbi:HAD-IIIA family hydrolase [Nitrospirillum sp. BR 11163]|uniref:HAD-IIIA family hydrolase n=1 Tax=Nitrospirillum sp. BR 11163 TaxID=3104323 RepID=UPI002AFEE60C|nr:HAD-IIIA family hydrolase [Nitrospirillum sp. BR 11163]MEA1672498.1 HAD-IIIA family hydrolase [Nitrospirillum sp. BR 11163]
MIQAVILAGGGGTRLKSVTGDLPKPLVDVCGTPLLGRQLEMIAQSSIRDVLVLTGYGAGAIADYCQDGAKWGLNLRTVAEPQARGTAGAVLDARDLLAPTFVVFYGDTVLDVDVDRLLAHHHQHGADATLFLHPNDHPYDSDLVDLDADGRVRRFLPYPHPEGMDYHNIVNAGLYVLERDAVLATGGLPDKPDFGKHVFSRMLAEGRTLQGYVSPEYVKDAGTPDRIAKVRTDIEKGRVARMSLRHPVPAVFLDRDGVLNVEKGRIARPEDLELTPGAAPALARLNRADYRTVVVTNQAIVARGDCTLEELDAIHARLETLLGAERAFFDRLYFCPHHPDKGFPKEVAALKIVCDCRKPAPGMVHSAARDLNIDVARSWMIGDSSSDMGLARACGMGGILVRSGHGGNDGKSTALPHLVVDDLAAAVRFILDAWPKLEARLDGLAADLRSGDVALIGGSARSGKSVLAQCLALHLARQGRRAVVLGLDSWLKSHDQRDDGVLGRYDLPAADRALTTLLARGPAVTPPRYDTATRLSHDGTEAISLAADDILIIEGVPALTQDAWLAKARKRWFVAADEDGRKRRFFQEYRRRGWSDDLIEATYQSRMQDELPVILASKDQAEQIISLDGILE